MSTILRKRSKKAGLPPGSLVHVSDIVRPKINISIMDYDRISLHEKQDISIEECLEHMQNASTTTWINIRGINDPKVLESIGQSLGLHALLLEDVMSAGQRSKLDDYKDYIFIVVRMLFNNTASDSIQDQQVSFVLGPNYLISFLEDSVDIFEPIRERLRSSKKRIRSMGADYLCYTMIDAIVDQYFVILEAVDKNLEVLEESLIHNHTPETMGKIQRLKREIVILRKSVWPMREVINNFRRLETPLISESTQLYLHDVYDHTIQAIDTIESFRDIASGMLDVYLSSISQHMNEIMKVLTIVATIFVPLTFIASLYGMNFDNMPELHWKWGYPVTLSIMAIVALTMIYYFRRKRWI